ncbi:hypothetical protein HIM_05609 [Hirsutella minnesotensis 3608]|uniref:Major facilitator superfamily (MFS) profile domain-containing protein n=1 Tax=Hirsutella minnesotensis 3608 TaxID=1043627 RepID=A0A0F7ZUM5_9HYPO|nr:hypothetical protein HIM_05609 [Hirsutella minnesotensis 3608]
MAHAPKEVTSQTSTEYEASDASSQNRSGPPSAAKMSTLTTGRFWFFSFGVYAGLFLSAIDASIVASSLHSIALDFQAFRLVNWVALAYTLAETGCVVVFARLADIIGRRTAFLLAMGLFLTFSIACGFSQTMGQLVAFRALQGVGAAGIYGISIIMLSEACPEHLFELSTALSGLVVVGAFILGPILGGAITGWTTWRWIFWMNGPICAASMITFLLSWPKGADIPSLTRHSFKSFDYIGSILLIAFSVLFVFAFQHVGSTIPSSWAGAVFIVPITISVACLVGLLTWGYLVHHRLAKDVLPTFPLSLFRNRFYAAAVLTTLLLGFPLLFLIYSVPLNAQIGTGKSAISASLLLLPLLGTTAAGGLAGALVNAKKNYIFECTFVGACLMTLGCALLTTTSSVGGDSKFLGYLTLAGFGSGITTSATTILVANEISPRNYGMN